MPVSDAIVASVDLGDVGLLPLTFKLHWIYLSSALCVAVLVYFFRRNEHPDTSLRQFLFPRSVWLHRSAITDYLFAGVTLPLAALLVSSPVLSYEAVSNAIAGFTSLLGQWQEASKPTLGVAVAYSVVLLLAVDFGDYWVHRWMHRSALLWEFHKVHHSAEVLTPVTVYRVHPLEQWLQGMIAAAFAGIVTGGFLCVFPHGLGPVTVLGVNASRFAFYILGANLRHSHIWLSYGSTLERIFVSPAQHQVHHSTDPRHIDRNFGFELALWDWMFGSLYLTNRRPETLEFGLGEAENRSLSSLGRLYFAPFAAAGKLLSGRLRQPA